MTRVSDLMWKEIPSVTAASAIRHVAEIMRRHGVDAVPVVQDEQERRPIGVITAAEIVGECVAAGHDPSACRAQIHMSTDFVLCQPDDSANPVLPPAAAKGKRSRAVVVVDEDRRLVGMLPSLPIEFEVVAAQRVEPMVGGMGGMELVWRCLDCGYQLLGAAAPPTSCPDCRAPREHFELVTED